MIAIDDAGNRSPLYDVAQFAIPCASGCPACLTNRLTWDPSPDSATEYRIYIPQASGVYDFGNPMVSIPASGPLEWPLADGNLAVGVRYYAVVTAVDAAGGESARSNEIDFIINGLP